MDAYAYAYICILIQTCSPCNPPSRPLITKQMEVKYTNIVTEYPEIINELTAKAESDELRLFNLSSFMSDRSLEYAFQKIDKDMKFFSVYIFMERLEDDLWEDERYTEKEEVRLCSRDTFLPMTAEIVSTFIEKKKACGSTFLIWLVILG